MEFPYVKGEGATGFVYRPAIPVTFSYGTRKFPVGNALVDTGADMTILPLEMAHALEIELDDSKSVVLGHAGGGSFIALPSQRKIGYAVELKGHRPLCWQGIAYFAAEQPMALLGHYQCLDKFDLLFRGKDRVLKLTLV